LLGEVEHRAPDSYPFTDLPNEDLQIPAASLGMPSLPWMKEARDGDELVVVRSDFRPRF
jgi:hypothetical protein